MGVVDPCGGAGGGVGFPPGALGIGGPFFESDGHDAAECSEGEGVVFPRGCLQGDLGGFAVGDEL